MASMEYHANALKIAVRELIEDGYHLVDGRSGNRIEWLDLSQEHPQFIEILKSGVVQDG